VKEEHQKEENEDEHHRDEMGKIEEVVQSEENKVQDWKMENDG
jgi:hypothetical protein